MEFLKEVFAVNWSGTIDTQNDYWVRAGVTTAAGVLAAAIPGVGVFLVVPIVLFYWPMYIVQRLRGLGYSPWLALLYIPAMALAIVPFIMFFGLGLVYANTEESGKGWAVSPGKGLALAKPIEEKQLTVEDLFK